MADRGAAPAPPAVDAHAHIFTHDMPFAPNAHSRPEYGYPVEAYLADLDRHGITHGVIAAASLFDDDNRYTLQSLAAHDRLRGTVIVPPETDPHSLRTLADSGVVGVRLQWRRAADFPDLTQAPWHGFLRGLADCGMHVELLAAGAMLPQLIPRFAGSGVTLVIDHFGVPARDPTERRAGTDALLRAVAAGRTWVKISAGFRLPYDIVEDVTTRLLAEAGPQRLLWGSDAPFVNHEDAIDFAGALALYHRLIPDIETRRAIDATARALYFNQASKTS